MRVSVWIDAVFVVKSLQDDYKHIACDRRSRCYLFCKKGASKMGRVKGGVLKGACSRGRVQGCVFKGASQMGRVKGGVLKGAC